MIDQPCADEVPLLLQEPPGALGAEDNRAIQCSSVPALSLAQLGVLGWRLQKAGR